MILLAEDGQPVIRHEVIRALRRFYSLRAGSRPLEPGDRGDDESLAVFSTELAHRAGDQRPRNGPHRSPPANSDLDAWLARLAGPADAEAGDGSSSIQGTRLLSLPRG